MLASQNEGIRRSTTKCRWGVSLSPNLLLYTSHGDADMSMFIKSLLLKN